MIATRRAMGPRLCRLEVLAREASRADAGALERLRLDPTGVMTAAGQTPDPWQERVLRSDADRLLLLCGRQCGKSSVSAALALSTALMTPRSPVLLLSPSDRQPGVQFDWLVFDEGYGSKVPFLRVLDAVGQRFVGEVPVNFSAAPATCGGPQRADAVLSAEAAKRGPLFRLPRKTLGDSRWRATSRPIEVHGCRWVLVVAINEATAEAKYFATNAVDEPLSRVLAAAFRRATIEHEFRVAEGEVGLMHYEGRQWLGLVRHPVLGLVVLGFVSIHTDRLREGKKRRCRWSKCAGR